MKDYDHKAIEAKWREAWAHDDTTHAKDGAASKKTYLLVEFPFPSGEGLHTGHVRGYAAMDIVARKRRRQGENVLFPIGWDAFGLPTENFAIKTKRDPHEVTKQNTDNYREQMKRLGLSFDWDREVNTTDPTYYKWTQWIFLQLYKNNLAYKATTSINWCPKDKIGLANEEVVDGKCERCGTPVEKRERQQWMLAITNYAERLYDDLDTVNYIERAKAGQRNWIGKSEGAVIKFKVESVKLKGDVEDKISQDSIEVFTTRPDTIFGATYVVLAPEHPFVQEQIRNPKSEIRNKSEIEEYIKESSQKEDIERTAEGKEKTGVQLNGVMAVNPATNEKIPVFVADYVLGSYGTGAVMAVPAHDERDFAFAKKYGLPIKQVVEPKFVGDSGEGAVRPNLPFVKRDAVCVIVRNPKDNTYLCNSWKNFKMNGLFTGGIEDGEDMIEAARRELQEETGYKNLRYVATSPIGINTFFYHRVKEQNRHAHFTFVFFDLENDERAEVDEKEAALHEVVWKTREELENFFTVFEGTFLLNLLDNPSYVHTDSGLLIDSGAFTGRDSEEAKKEIVAAVGGTWTTKFKLRDWVFSRQRYWGEPIPMIHCEKCGWVAVPEDQLPVELPHVDHYEPTDNGDSPLATIDAWVNVTCPTCGGAARRETDVMPNWAGSSWYYLRYTDPRNDTALAGKEKLDYWTPVDWYNGGMEHTTLHVLYSRFWHKFLYDIGVVPTSEPYAKRTSHGLILAEGGEKMSKSKGNIVNPDDMIERFGADTLRIYEMFMGPFDQAIAWSTDGLVGSRRFLERVIRLGEKIGVGTLSDAATTIMHQSIKKVTEDIEALRMNTAVSQLMILSNTLEKEAVVPRDSYQIFLALLAPFAPFLAEELWREAGGEESVHAAPWPAFDPEKLMEREVTVALQINGKVRGTITCAKDTDEATLLALARAEKNTEKWLNGKEIVKIVTIPNKVINIVVREEIAHKGLIPGASGE